MIEAARQAIRDVFSPPFRRVLWTSLALTILLFAVLLAATGLGLSMLTVVRWPWLDRTIDVVLGLGLVIGLVFLAGPVTAAFAGLFLDGIAALVERTHYPADAPGTPLPAIPAAIMSLRFLVVMIVVHVLLLPLVFLAVGAVVLLAANAYLISREYFELTAMRHLPRREAQALRKANGRRLFLAGILPALLALVPLANLFVPMFATSYFTHLFKRLSRP
jgi:CysZ protein